MPVFSDGQKISASLAWDRMIQSVPASYVVWKDGSTYRAECLLKGGTDYSGTDAATVIQSAIDAHTNSEPTRIYCKGTISLSSAITLDNKRNLILEFEKFIFTSSSAQIIIRNKSNRAVTIVRGLYIVVSADPYSNDAVYLENVRNVEVKIGMIENTGDATPPWQGSGVHLHSDDDSIGGMDINVNVGYIAGFEKGVYLTVGSTEGYLSINRIKVDHIGWCVYAVKIEANTDGSSRIFHNDFWVRTTPPTPSGYSTSYGIYLTGKAYGNTFWDYDAWDLSANEVAYYADSNVLGTRFVGGMPRHDAGSPYWDDNGQYTELIDVYEPDKTPYSVFADRKSGTATISSSTYVDVTHGLAGTPTAINVTPATSGTGDWYISDIGDTTFRINVANSGTYTFHWTAEYKP